MPLQLGMATDIECFCTKICRSVASLVSPSYCCFPPHFHLLHSSSFSSKSSYSCYSTSSPSSSSSTYSSYATQGAGVLTVIGPPGLRGLIETMTPFTNKKYPELDIIEVGSPVAGRDHRVDVMVELEYMRVVVRPVFVAKVCIASEYLGTSL